jgi:hypothetical protein
MVARSRRGDRSQLMQTIGTILVFVWLGAMVALPFVLFALLWHKAGEELERHDSHRPRHAW